jgi:hypothetical protein
LTLTTYNPAISNDYTVNQIASLDAGLPYVVGKMFYAFLAGVTPVTTMLVPRTDAARSAGSGPEVDLNCLKVKEVNHTESTSPSEVESGAARMAIYGHAALAMLIMMLAVMCFPRGDSLWS